MDRTTLFGNSLNHTNAGLSLGTTSTYTTAAATVCSIRGKFATALSAQTNTASPTTDARTGVTFPSLAINKATVLVWGINAAGAIRLCQGSIEDTEAGSGATAGAFRNTPQFPALPDDFCPIAYNLVRTAPNASTWTAGSSSWTATAVTASTPANIAVMPDRPQTA